MKNIFLCVLLILSIQPAFAATNIRNPESLNLRLSIRDTTHINGNVSQTAINNQITMSLNNKWLQLGGSYGYAVLTNARKSPQEITHEETVHLILSKLIALNNNNATVQFMLIDASNQNGTVIFDPKMTLPYNRETTLTINKEGHNIQIQVFASKN
jgi:hypothetical protein